MGLFSRVSMQGDGLDKLPGQTPKEGIRGQAAQGWAWRLAVVHRGYVVGLPSWSNAEEEVVALHSVSACTATGHALR